MSEVLAITIAAFQEHWRRYGSLLTVAGDYAEPADQACPGAIGTEANAQIGGGFSSGGFAAREGRCFIGCKSSCYVIPIFAKR